MATALKNYLTEPRPPNVAAGFIDAGFAVVELKRSRRGYDTEASAITPLAGGIVTPSFDQPNVHDIRELVGIIAETAEAAGLKNRRKWSVALPEGAARTLIVTLESKPANRRELNEVMGWKIERLVAAPIDELRVSRQHLSRVGSQERYLVTIARHDVINQYEEAFEAVGWKAGLLLPRHLGEARWILMDESPGDKMLVSANTEGFTSVVVVHGEPALIRSHVCDPGSLMDELHRSALYYRDRLAEATGSVPNLTGLLVIGPLDQLEALRVISAALDVTPKLIDPSQFGFDLPGGRAQFDQLAAVAGLASLAWQ